MKRFVSYLYSIYNNQKIHNAGFARIELRTGRNRIDIHLRENGYAGKTGTVYLFIRAQENIQGIPIGNITFRNNQADFRYEQSEENIGQTPWQIMQMHGILVMIDDRAAFLSQWDEQPVDTTRFEVWNIDKLAEERAAESKQNQDAPLMNEANKDVRSTNENEVNQETNQFHKNGSNRQVALSSENGANRQVKFSNENGADQKAELSNEDATYEMGSDNIKNTNADASNNQPSGTNKESVQNNVSLKQSLKQDIMGSEQTTKINAENETGSQPSSSLPSSNIRTAELQTQPINQWEQNWRYMLRAYPVLNQFAEQNHVICVRIEIKDVRLLPQKYWSMINNSFLLHGFFNYRYLVVGRIGQNWFIGIPGIYQSQEHVMASIFGFPDFLPQSQKNERGEQPGYWYRILDIS